MTMIESASFVPFGWLSLGLFPSFSLPLPLSLPPSLTHFVQLISICLIRDRERKKMRSDCSQAGLAINAWREGSRAG